MFLLGWHARSSAFIQRIPNSTLRGLFGSIEQLRGAYSPANICSFLDAPFALLFLFVLYLISPPLALVAVIVMGALALVIFIQFNGLRELGRSINKLSALQRPDYDERDRDARDRKGI